MILIRNKDIKNLVVAKGQNLDAVRWNLGHAKGS